MGQQQLLLIMLTVILIGVALAVGLNLFTANAIEQKRNEIINECTLLASEAQLYYRRPKVYGGGGKSFLGWTVPPQYQVTEAGYLIAADIKTDEVTITGTGNEIANGTDSIKVQVIVTPLSMQTTVIH